MSFLFYIFIKIIYYTKLKLFLIFEIWKFSSKIILAIDSCRKYSLFL